MQEIPFRQVHLDFHTSEQIPGVGSEFDPARFVETLRRAAVNSITVSMRENSCGRILSPDHLLYLLTPRCFDLCRRTFARFPQSRMSHQQRLWFRLASRNNQPQPSPGQRPTASTP